MKNVSELDRRSTRCGKYAHALAANAMRGMILDKPALATHIKATVVKTLPNGIKKYCYIDDEGIVVDWTYGMEFKVYGEKIEL